MRGDTGEGDWVDELIDEVSQRLDEAEGIATFELTELKALGGIGRLGRRIREQMQEAFDSAEIGYFPSPLPASDTQRVRLYRLGSKVERLIMAVVTVDEENDLKLRRFARGGAPLDASGEREALQKIRRILDRLQ
jgi:hypothetical protein